MSEKPQETLFEKAVRVAGETADSWRESLGTYSRVRLYHQYLYQPFTDYFRAELSGSMEDRNREERAKQRLSAMLESMLRAAKSQADTKPELAAEAFHAYQEIEEIAKSLVDSYKAMRDKRENIRSNTSNKTTSLLSTFITEELSQHCDREYDSYDRDTVYYLTTSSLPHFNALVDRLGAKAAAICAELIEARKTELDALNKSPLAMKLELGERAIEGVFQAFMRRAELTQSIKTVRAPVSTPQ